MPASKLLSTALAATALAASGGVAVAADDPVVSQQSWTAGAALADFPAVGLEKGEWTGSKAKMLFRDVTVEEGQVARVTFRAPAGLRIRAIGHVKGQELSVRARDVHYRGDRSVTLRVKIADGVADDTVTGRVYVLAK